jgi:hypothetical protein
MATPCVPVVNGGCGTGAGDVVAEAVAAVDGPLAFTAVTLIEYAVPALRPAMVQLVAVAATVPHVVVTLPAVAVTL